MALAALATAQSEAVLATADPTSQLKEALVTMEVLPDLQAQQTPAQWITPQLFPLTLPFPLPAGLPLPALLRPEGKPTESLSK